jgi:hypothetical protein
MARVQKIWGGGAKNVYGEEESGGCVWEASERMEVFWKGFRKAFGP